MQDMHGTGKGKTHIAPICLCIHFSWCTVACVVLRVGWGIECAKVPPPLCRSPKTPRGGLGGGLRGVFWRPPRHGGVYPPRRGTNNRGELRAALRGLQGHREGHQSLICPDSLLVVNGVLGWAQRWRRHGWQNKSGAVAHVDLWTQILHLVEKLEEAIKWLHSPSHVGIKGNGQADHLANVGRRRSPHQKTRNQTTSRKSPSGGGRRSVSRNQRQRPAQV